MKLIQFAASILSCSIIAAAAEPTSCPDTINVRQELTSPSQGWTPSLDAAPHRLAGITFYDGPLQDNASLVNDRATKSAGKETAVWHFTPQQGRQIFLACSYSATTVVLSKPLPPKTTSCSVTYDVRTRIAGLPLIEKITCK